MNYYARVQRPTPEAGEAFNPNKLTVYLQDSYGLYLQVNKVTGIGTATMSTSKDPRPLLVYSKDLTVELADALREVADAIEKSYED